MDCVSETSHFYCYGLSKLLYFENNKQIDRTYLDRYTDDVHRKCSFKCSWNVERWGAIWAQDWLPHLCQDANVWLLPTRADITVASRWTHLTNCSRRRHFLPHILRPQKVLWEVTWFWAWMSMTDCLCLSLRGGDAWGASLAVAGSPLSPGPETSDRSLLLLSFSSFSFYSSFSPSSRLLHPLASLGQVQEQQQQATHCHPLPRTLGSFPSLQIFCNKN